MQLLRVGYTLAYTANNNHYYRYMLNMKGNMSNLSSQFLHIVGTIENLDNSQLNCDFLRICCDNSFHTCKSGNIDNRFRQYGHFLHIYFQWC